MAHWAELDENNIVLQVTVGDNAAEDEGYGWLMENKGGTWVKTSFNTHAGVHALGGTPFRKNYAGPGYTYDEVRDAFIPPKPYDSWVLNEDTCIWNAPTPMPQDGKVYIWNEANIAWDEVSIPE